MKKVEVFCYDYVEKTKAFRFKYEENEGFPINIVENSRLGQEPNHKDKIPKQKTNKNSNKKGTS